MLYSSARAKFGGHLGKILAVVTLGISLGMCLFLWLITLAPHDHSL